MILILGKNGQVSRALQEQKWTEEVRVLGSDELDLSAPLTVVSRLNELVNVNPRLVINAAAYTAVDKAESERELAFKINAESVGELGKWCAKQDIPVVHFSTDYVYPGTGERPWTELDPVAPLNVYGESKLAGENALISSGAKAYIFRISWVVSPFGNNFVKTMLRLGADRAQLRVVDDQIGSPMSALQIADLVHQIFASGNPQVTAGVYNLSSGPFVSWCGFASAIFNAAKNENISLKISDVVAIPTSVFPTPARRPQNSRMSDQKLKDVFGVSLADWRDGLNDIVRRLK